MEEIHVTSSFFCSHYVFKSLFPNDCEILELYGKGLTLSQITNFRPRDFAEDNFKFDEKSRKFSRRVENTEGKGEIAHFEQFLLFSQCFQKTCTADM